MPTRGPAESRDDFIERCMGDDKMNEEFPDREQRFAVCRSYAEGSEEANLEKTDNIVTSNMGCSCDGNIEQVEARSSALPLASRGRAWSGSGAGKRMLDVATSDDEISKSKASRGFTLIRGDPQNRTSYILPFADVVDGNVQVVYRGVTAALGALSGARGGVKDISDSERKGAISFLEGQRGRFEKDKEAANECPEGEELKDGYCQPVAVTLDLDIGEAVAVVEASTGKTIVRISGIAFHEGINKNGWGLTAEGAEAVTEQMIGADITLNHPSPEGGTFTRNMDGGVEEAVVGIITEATFNVTEDGWEVRYVGEIHRDELFASLESGLYLRPDYGVSIGGTGIPSKIISYDDGTQEMFFGPGFKFDHLAIVHKPAYEKASIEEVEKVEIANEEMFNSDSATNSVQSETVIDMTDEENNREAEIEALQADMVLRDAQIAEFEAAEAARIEEDRTTLVSKATDLGLNGHEDFSVETLEKVIASWEASRPEPIPEPVVEMKPATPAATETVEASEPEPVSVVANYFNGKLVETEENLYERAWNSWAKAYNKVVDQKAEKALLWADAKEMI